MSKYIHRTYKSMLRSIQMIENARDPILCLNPTGKTARWRRITEKGFEMIEVPNRRVERRIERNERRAFRTFSEKVQAFSAGHDAEEARQDVEEFAGILQHTASSSLRWRAAAVLGVVALSSPNKAAKRAAKHALKELRFVG